MYIYSLELLWCGNANEHQYHSLCRILTPWIRCLSFELQFYGPVNTAKVMSSWSVNLLMRFLALFSRWLTSTCAQTFASIIGNCPSWIRRKGRNYFMINLQEIFMAKMGFALATPGSAVICPTDFAIERSITRLKMFVSSRKCSYLSHFC